MSRLTAAAANFAYVWDGDLAVDIGPKLTCVEVDALADLFRSEDRIDLAETWIEAHAISDDEGDSHYRGREA